MRIVLLLLILSPFVFILTGLLVLARMRGRLSRATPLARRAADRIERGLRVTSGWFSPPPVINPAHLLLGILLLGFLLYAIRRYLPLYTAALSVVTGLSLKESSGLALWLVLVTAFVGIFLELAFDDEVFHNQHSEWLRWIKVFLGVIVLVLMFFQAFVYYTFLRQSVGGGVPGLGGGTFFLIAAIEAITFFFITKLAWVPAGFMIVRLIRSPFVVVVMFFRSLERLFEGPPQEQLQKHEAGGDAGPASL